MKAQRKTYKKKQSKRVLAVGTVLSIAVVCMGVGIATQFAGAHGAPDNTFGLSAQVQTTPITSTVSSSSQEVKEQLVLSGTSSRDISKGIKAIEAAEEEARLAAEAEAAAAKAAAEAEKRAAATSSAQIAQTNTSHALNESSVEGGWQTGTASAYNIASCYGSTLTASGATLTEDSVTCAVPAGQSYLMGRSVEIKWNGITVVATVTDTGGFGAYGRALDLAPGVCKAFGIDTSGAASNCNKWGVQTVQYRFI